ncbi:queuosine salvage protein-like isoform X2 [Daphnia pulicaria]|uniref:queuosine salvage protein-like isoform X2 n=1 Tax=Daphnia pulicaria TaxID=35523 RepID=UPI001EEAC252|nr:queuosine salvage protein-like isoform X2 [Daphnia pulicaria]
MEIIFSYYHVKDRPSYLIASILTVPLSKMNPRESAAFIASVSKDVEINPDGIRKIASEISRAIASREFEPSNMMIHSYPLPVTEDVSSIEWLFVADALNFSFWALEENVHYSVELHEKQYTGYMALCAAITKALEADIPITSSQYYATITKEEVDKIFISSTGESIPLLEERWRILQECGKILNEKFDGKFYNCIKQSANSATKLLNLIISNFPSFRDEGVIEGKKVSFYKRAQILVADIWSIFKGKGFGNFTDVDSITMFADYRVPQSLVHFGAMAYSDRLHGLLLANHMFLNGDREEMEIRGCSIHSVELIKEELKSHQVNTTTNSLPMNSAMIDYFLWEYRRRFAQTLAKVPYHKVRCIYY